MSGQAEQCGGVLSVEGGADISEDEETLSEKHKNKFSFHKQ